MFFVVFFFSFVIINRIKTFKSQQTFKLIESGLLELDNLFDRPKYKFKNNDQVRIAKDRLTVDDLQTCLESKWINLLIKKLIVGIDGNLYFDFHYIVTEGFIYIHPSGVDNIITTNLINQIGYLESFNGKNWQNKDISLLMQERSNYNEDDNYNNQQQQDKERWLLAMENKRRTFISTLIKKYNFNLVYAYYLLHKLDGKYKYK